MASASKQQLDQAAETIETKATEAINGAKDSVSAARETLSDAGDRIVGTLRSTAEAASSASSRAIESVSEAADSLRKRDFNEIVGGAQDYARRNPGTVAIGAAVAGFALAHLLRAATRQSAAERLYSDATRRATEAVSRVRDGGWRG